MGFDPRVAEAVGLAAAVWALVWIGLRYVWKKSAHAPGISLQLFAISLGIWIAGNVFYPGREWTGHVGAVLIVLGTMFGWVVFENLTRKQHAEVPAILRQLCGAVVVLVAVASVLKWGYHLELTGLLATSGVAAVIIGFAMQDLLANVIAGFSIHITGAYKVGDWLKMGESGHRAEVTEINWRSTRLIDNDRVSFELPNSEVVKNRIVNLNRPGQEHGVRLRFGLDYDTPPALAKEVLIGVAKNAQGVLENPAPVVFTLDFSDSAVIYELRYWMRHARLHNATADEIRTALWYEMRRRGMKVPFPTRSLEVREGNVPPSLNPSREKAGKILAGGSALSCLTEEEVSDLVEKGRLLLFGPQEALVTRGEKGESMFVIIEGQVEVIGKTADGPRVVLASLGAGECFGEMSLVTGEPRNATVRAVGDTVVLEISKHHLSPLMEAETSLAERLGELLETRQKNWEEGIEKAGTGTSRKTGQSAATRSLVSRIRVFFGQDS